MKILIVDDKAENLYLIERMINKMGYKSVSAENGQDALEKLNNDNFDMIVSDILMPVMDGYQLCKTVRNSKKFKDILFIFYTSTYTDEEDEKFALSLGADKFLRKPLNPKIFLKIIEDTIQNSVVSAPKPSKIVIKEEKDMFKLYSERLINKLEQKISELKKERLKLQEAEEEIRKRNILLNNVIESFTYPFIVINVDNYKVILANSAAKSNDISNDICCYSLTHHREKPCIEVQVCPLEEVKKVKKPIITEHLHYDANGHTKIVEVHGYPIFDEKENVIQMIIYVFDISERKRALKELQESEKKFRNLYDEAPNAYFSVSRDKSITNCNKAAEKLLGYSKAEILKLSVSDLYADTDQGILKALGIFKRLLNNEIIHDEELMMQKKNGKPIWISLSVKPILDKNGNVIESRSMVSDITEHKKADQKVKRTVEDLQHSNEEQKKAKEELQKNKISLENAQRIARVGNWDWNIVTNELYWSDEIYRIFGLKPIEFGATYESFIKTVHPDDREFVQISVDEALHENKPYSIDHSIVLSNGAVRIVHEEAEVSFDETGKAIKMVGTVQDITERKRAEKKLYKTMKDLERSNAELEQFAYIASHDLQEPLRSVASFTQLLQQRYKDKLDEDANEFIKFAVDGATRMQSLIQDLLLLSRVGTRGEPFKETDMNIILNYVIENITQSIKDTNAKITNDPLPVIFADDSQMIQLLQNLILNAIKFHGDEPPHIHISAKAKAKDWVFSVKDNGIGIDSKYFEKIFVVFQRLHKGGEYEGTGIGLAVCKKIAQRHGGKIWVESAGKNKGSTFIVKLPIKDS